MIPYRCPICLGRGFVPGGFYSSTGDSGVASTLSENCKSCNGTGIIWSTENNQVHIEIPDINIKIPAINCYDNYHKSLTEIANTVSDFNPKFDGEKEFFYRNQLKYVIRYAKEALAKVENKETNKGKAK